MLDKKMAHCILHFFKVVTLLQILLFKVMGFKDLRPRPSQR